MGTVHQPSSPASQGHARENDDGEGWIGKGHVYAAAPAEAYEAHTCAECYEIDRKSAGTEGNPANIELVAELRPAQGDRH